MMRVLLLALTALALSACATTRPGTGPTGPGSTGPAWTEIEIAEGACYGFCPIYTITVTPDDRYTLNGERFTRHDGQTSGRLEAGSFQRLAAILQAHDAAALPADITMNNPAACGRTMMSDLPDFRLGLTGPAGRQDIVWYPGCADSPYREALSQIRDQVRVAYQYETLIVPKR
ncbi:DUF6438 domain-containing protein [Maricaulis sp.]|uniref:DUF6438 domain-containing protein n=2 Tax=Maricaulis sp. TaxID=1486257 RepID=UPI003A8CAE82